MFSGLKNKSNLKLELPFTKSIVVYLKITQLKWNWVILKIQWKLHHVARCEGCEGCDGWEGCEGCEGWEGCEGCDRSEGWKGRNGNLCILLTNLWTLLTLFKFLPAFSFTSFAPFSTFLPSHQPSCHSHQPLQFSHQPSHPSHNFYSCQSLTPCTSRVSCVGEIAKDFSTKMRDLSPHVTRWKRPRKTEIECMLIP